MNTIPFLTKHFPLTGFSKQAMLNWGVLLKMQTQTKVSPTRSIAEQRLSSVFPPEGPLEDKSQAKAKHRRSFESMGAGEENTAQMLFKMSIKTGVNQIS